MPELPEVETVKRGMEQALLKKHIKSVQINRHDLRKPIPQDFGQSITNKELRALSRRGKYIIMHIGANTETTAILHLGMSGRIHILAPDDLYTPRKHDHVIITMDDNTRFTFEDPRRFGMFYTINTNWQESEPFISMGAEPLETWSKQNFLSAIRNKSAPIKSTLLDQRIVAGLGNIYVCEALFRTGIHPARPAKNISAQEADKIITHTRDILNEAIASGGSSLKDYQHTDGSLGYFQHKFAVYNQEGKTCSTLPCTAKIHRINQAGRSTFYCPNCQKM